MTISYKLELGASVTEKAVMDAIVAAAPDAIEEYEGYHGSLRNGGYFDVELAEYDPPDPVEEEFGFAPKAEVYFGLKKLADFEAQETDVIRLSLGVLARIPGDALLHAQHDEAWLLRRGGQLTVNASLWKPQQLALLTQPYESDYLGFS